MTLVFEARRLPFDCVNEEYASQLEAILGSGPIGDIGLSLWRRCMLVPVLPLVTELRQQAADAQVHSSPDHKEDDPCIPSPEDISIALRILDELDELEVALDHIRSLQSIDAASSRTAEEDLMDQLLRERGALLDEPPQPHSETDMGEADLAMCFSFNGDCLGIGPAALFGGHGIHKE